MPPSLIFIILSSLSLCIAEDRPHGLAWEHPIAPISPQAYGFFNPDTTSAPPPIKPKQCRSSNCNTLPLAATVKSTPAHESVASSGHQGLGAGGVFAISLSFVIMCIVGVGVYYVTIKRRANLRKANAEQPASA